MSREMCAAVLCVIRVIRQNVPLDCEGARRPCWPNPCASGLESYARMLEDRDTVDQAVQTRAGMAELTAALRHTHALIQAAPSIRDGDLGCLFEELLDTHLYVWWRVRTPLDRRPAEACIDLFPIEGALLDSLREAARGLHSTPAAGETGRDKEWLPVGEAIERAVRAKFPVSASWLSRPPRKSGVKTRQRQMPGNHQREVAWDSLAGYLLREKPQESDGDEPQPTEVAAIEERKKSAARSKQLDRSTE